jgi:hypothetical protein
MTERLESLQTAPELATLLEGFKKEEKFLRKEVAKPSVEKKVDADFVKKTLTFNGKALHNIEISPIEGSSDTFKFAYELETSSTTKKDIDVYFVYSYDQKLQEAFINVIDVKGKNKD